jgi:hypothetical protein
MTLNAAGSTFWEVSYSFWNKPADDCHSGNTLQDVYLHFGVAGFMLMAIFSG